MIEAIQPIVTHYIISDAKLWKFINIFITSKYLEILQYFGSFWHFWSSYSNHNRKAGWLYFLQDSVSTFPSLHSQCCHSLKPETEMECYNLIWYTLYYNDQSGLSPIYGRRNSHNHNSTLLLKLHKIIQTTMSHA